MVSQLFVLRVQGGYYLVTGVWPLVHLASFEAITGPKVDDWLVRMVGLLAAVIEATLLAAARGTRTREIYVLSIGSAFAFRGDRHLVRPSRADLTGVSSGRGGGTRYGCVVCLGPPRRMNP